MRLSHKLAALSVVAGTSVGGFVATTAVPAGALTSRGFTKPTASLTLDLSSFAYSICGDNAFEETPDGKPVLQVQYAPGAGPFGGGTYNCATGELTL